jgi:hypothetical protein
VPNSSERISPAEQTLREIAHERILVLDGAMGTMIQARRRALSMSGAFARNMLGSPPRMPGASKASSGSHLPTRAPMPLKLDWSGSYRPPPRYLAGQCRRR